MMEPLYNGSVIRVRNVIIIHIYAHSINARGKTWERIKLKKHTHVHTCIAVTAYHMVKESACVYIYIYAL